MITNNILIKHNRTRRFGSKGEGSSIGFLVAMVLAVILLIVVGYLISKSSKQFNDSVLKQITCEDAGGVCKSKCGANEYASNSICKDKTKPYCCFDSKTNIIFKIKLVTAKDYEFVDYYKDSEGPMINIPVISDNNQLVGTLQSTNNDVCAVLTITDMLTGDKIDKPIKVLTDDELKNLLKTEWNQQSTMKLDSISKNSIEQFKTTEKLNFKFEFTNDDTLAILLRGLQSKDSIPKSREFKLTIRSFSCSAHYDKESDTYDLTTQFGDDTESQYLNFYLPVPSLKIAAVNDKNSELVRLLGNKNTLYYQRIITTPSGSSRLISPGDSAIVYSNDERLAHLRLICDNCQKISLEVNEYLEKEGEYQYLTMPKSSNTVASPNEIEYNDFPLQLTHNAEYPEISGKGKLSCQQKITSKVDEEDSNGFFSRLTKKKKEYGISTQQLSCDYDLGFKPTFKGNVYYAVMEVTAQSISDDELKNIKQSRIDINKLKETLTTHKKIFFTIYPEYSDRIVLFGVSDNVVRKGELTLMKSTDLSIENNIKLTPVDNPYDCFFKEDIFDKESTINYPLSSGSKYKDKIVYRIPVEDSRFSDKFVCAEVKLEGPDQSANEDDYLRLLAVNNVIDRRFKKLRIDDNPPFLFLEYNPLRYELLATCVDSRIEAEYQFKDQYVPRSDYDDNAAISGCNDESISIAYVTDPLQFATSIITSTGLMTDWNGCPAPDDAGSWAHVPATRSGVFDHSSTATIQRVVLPGELKVICVRATDAAGNSIVSHKLVWDPSVPLAMLASKYVN